MHEKITIAEYVARRLMEDSGYGKEVDSLEWDPNNVDSQYSINLTIAEVCVAATIDALKILGVLPDEEDVAEEDIVESRRHGHDAPNPQYDIAQEYPIHRQATIYSILKSNGFDPLTLGDVRRWIDEADEFQLPDFTHVEGDLSLMYDIGLSAVKRTTYLGEGDEGDDVIVLYGRQGDRSPYSPNHPSVFYKDPKFMLEKTYQTLLKKYEYLVENGHDTEALLILGEIERIKDVVG